MIKKIIKNKKILAIIMLILTIFNTISPVMAASGSGKFVGGQFASRVFTTDNQNTENGILIRKLINQTTGKEYTVFCAEHGVDFTTGSVYNGQYYTPTNATIKKACQIAYFGWYKTQGDYVVNGGILDGWASEIKLSYVFTQQYIWEVLGQSNATFIDSGIQSRYVSFKADIDRQIAEMKKRPSFDGTLIEVQAGETTTVTDTNGILQGYNSVDNTYNGVRFQHTKGENTLKITVSEDCNIENLSISDATMKSWGLVKEGTEDHDSSIYFTFDDAQAQLYSLHYNDPTTLSLDLKINLFGKLELHKLNTNGDLIDGAKFRVTGPNGYNQLVTVTNGKILLEKLKKGTYSICEESSPEGYLLNTETYKAVVKPNQTTTQAIVDDEPTGELTLIKTDLKTGNQNRADVTSHQGDASINGAVYTLYAKSDIYNKKGTVKYFNKDEQIATFTFNQYGVASIKITNNSTPAQLSVKGNKLAGLPMGAFYAKETTVPQGYKQDTNVYDEIFTFKDNKTKVIEVTGTVKNDVQKAPFEVVKVTTNDNTVAEYVADAEFTAILTKYVDFYGSFEEAKKHLNEFADDEYSVFRTGSNGHGVSGLLAYRKLYCK